MGHGGVLDLAKAVAAIIPHPGISMFLRGGFFMVWGVAARLDPFVMERGVVTESSP